MINLISAINTDHLLLSLDILWKGMLAIVVVIGIVIGATYLMNFVAKKVAENKEKQAANPDQKKPSLKEKLAKIPAIIPALPFFSVGLFMPLASETLNASIAKPTPSKILLKKNVKSRFIRLL